VTLLPASVRIDVAVYGGRSMSLQIEEGWTSCLERRAFPATRPPPAIACLSVLNPTGRWLNDPSAWCGSIMGQQRSGITVYAVYWASHLPLERPEQVPSEPNGTEQCVTVSDMPRMLYPCPMRGPSASHKVNEVPAGQVADLGAKRVAGGPRVW
jgi:hypothetical protein